MMVEYVLKSAACMGAFLLFYQFLLEKENMHVFKRFFLLGALIVSLIVPLIVFTEYVQVTPVSSPIESSFQINSSINTSKVSDINVVNWNLLFWSIYVLGTIGLGIRFIRHLFQINGRIRKNTKLRRPRFTQVLLLEKMPPHTFFKFIFLNKKEVEQKNIPPEVLLHEETHAKQLHSVDVLFVELLQVILWFNPLVYLFKKNIKLNHEFLADSAVLKENVPAKNYQNTLLSYLSKESNQKYQSVSMANAINYSSTRLTVFGKTFQFGSAVGQVKKRFTVMKKRTSKKSIILRSLLLIPLITLLLFGFSTRRELPKITDTSTEKTKYTARSLSIEVLDDGTYLIEGIAANKNSFSEVVDIFNRDITSEIRNNILNIHLSASGEITNEEVWFIYNSFLEYGFYRIVAPNQEIIRPKGNKPFAIEGEYDSNKGVLRKELREYNSIAKKYNTVPIEKRTIPLKDLKILEAIYKKMSKTQKENAQPFPECLPKNLQESATREQMKEYNALAKKYNEMPKNNMRVKMKDVEKLKYIYSIMSDKQRADAEPFPDFPKPPPPPKSPKVMKGEVSDIPPPKAKSPRVLKGEKSEIPPPPPPPLPPDPLDHAIQMAKKGATFYYEGEKISADKAIEILKKNKSLNIESKSANTDNPVVKISKSPIVIK